MVTELLTLDCVLDNEDNLMILDDIDGRLQFVINEYGNSCVVTLDSNQLKDIANLINLKVGK